MRTIWEIRERSRLCSQTAKDAADAADALLRVRLGTRALVLAMLARIESERAPRKHKAVFLNGTRIGAAHTWHDVAELVSESLDRRISAKAIVPYGSEGPRGFYVRMPGKRAR